MDDYFYDEYDGEYEESSYTDTELFKPRFNDLAMECVWPSLVQITSYAAKFLVTNLVFRLCTQTVKVPPALKHGVSALTGAALIFMTMETSLYILGFAIIPYFLIFLLEKLRYRRLGYVTSLVVVSSLIVCEILEKNHRKWHQLRGTLMIIVMKVISLAFDFDAGQFRELPKILPYIGYMLCPSSVILGPWHSFEQYVKVLDNRSWKLSYILNLTANIIVSLGFLLCSNCVMYFLIPDNSWKWFVAYRDALVFRCSHYFISFLSQGTMVAGGFTSPDVSLSSKIFGYEVTQPHKLELPRSLVQVVKCWNIPMNTWLKKYVFRIIKPHSTFLAILVTYVVSSVLHGINVQVAAVLISLGFYTYVEFNLRKKVSSIFNSCTLAGACKSTSKRNCDHELKEATTFSVLINLLFSATTVFHLAYLGVMFEAAFYVQEQGFSFQNLVEKWGALNYASHWVVLFTYVFYWII